ncbi:hypothetical protein FN846DRAFT_889428 [Sphaerosporella brunnea]|uniref:C2H2-type domain-containing protein n=1 Tax=Sphaerosporella brunnea TaxID=1250544 RepID=A0A5J5EZW2_9PEZI|nr:hypothetical protein FN846DRAFT_889428 [Sphaerosporella brunnea]
MGHFSFCSSNTSDDDQEEDYKREEDEPSVLPVNENLSKPQEEHPFEKEGWESEEDWDEALILAGRPACDRRRSQKELAKEDTKPQQAYQEFEEEEDTERVEEDEPDSQPERLVETKQTQDQALEKEDESQEEYCDSEEEYCHSEDEDEDEVTVSSVPRSGATTKSDHAQQKEAVIEKQDYDKEEDYDSEVSWGFWSSLARRYLSVRLCRLRSLWETNDVLWTQQIPAWARPGNQPCLQEPWRVPETAHLPTLQFLKFSGDRDTDTAMVDWFLPLVAEYVRLGGGVGVSQDDRMINTVLENLSREPRRGKDRAYRWAISWIGSRSGLSIYMGVSYAWPPNYATGKNVYKPPSTVPVHKHYPFSWVEFVDAWMDEFDPERREASRFQQNAFDQGRFRGEASYRRGEDSRRWQPKSEQSTDALRAQQRQPDCQPQDNDVLQEGAAFRYRSQDFRRCEKDSENALALEERIALLEKHVACLEGEFKAIHTKLSTVGIVLEKAQQGLFHCCRVCPQTFGFSTQLHRHLRNSKHFPLPPSLASRSEGVRASGSSAAPSSNEDVPLCTYICASGNTSQQGPHSVLAIFNCYACRAIKGCPTATLPDLAGLNGEIQFKADTSNHTASESDREASIKRKCVARKATLAEVRPLPVPIDAGTTEWRSRDKFVDELASKNPDRKATEVAPPQKISLQTQACRLLNDCSTELEPTIVTATYKDFRKPRIIGDPARSD